MNAMASHPCEGPSDVAAPRILLVDDHYDTVYFMSRLLQMAGFDVRYATCGDQALQLAEEEPCDVVISDLNLPGMDGFTLMRRLHGMNEKTLGIAVSGYGEADYADVCQEAGFSEFLSKPIDLPQLQAAIHRVVARGATIASG
jgi:CheY-like chemotaxis protein